MSSRFWHDAVSLNYGTRGLAIVRTPRLLILLALGAFAVATQANSGCASSSNSSSEPTKSPALVQQTGTTSAPAVHARPQTFRGSGTENLGTINVATASTLHWSCPSCSSDNFAINNSFNDSHEISVNDINKTSGVTAIDPGTYHDVEVLTEGEDWTLRIEPGQ